MPPLPDLTETTPDDPPEPEPLLVPNSPFPQAVWARAAMLLAAGARVAEVAGETGISRSAIWRARQGQPRFVALIREWEAKVRRDREARFVGMTDLVMDGLARRLAEGDVRTLLWAASRLGIGVGEWLAAPSEVPPPETAAEVAARAGAVSAQARHRAYILDLLAGAEERMAEYRRDHPFTHAEMDAAQAAVQVAEARRNATVVRALADEAAAQSGWSRDQGRPPDPFGDE